MTCTLVSFHVFFFSSMFISNFCIPSDSYYIPYLLLYYFAGDPKADLAYERQYEQQTYHVIPEVIKNFLQYFHKTISDLIDQKVYELQSNRVSSESIEQKIYEIQDVYENRYVPVNNTCLLKERNLNTVISDPVVSSFSWNKLTDRFFKTSPWPEAEAIASLVGNG